MTERARMENQYGVGPSDRQGAGDSSGSSATNFFPLPPLPRRHRLVNFIEDEVIGG